MSPQVVVPTSSRISGVAIQTFKDGAQLPDINFAQIKSDGANMVNFTVWWQAPSSSSDTVQPEYGSETVSDAQLETLLSQAEQAGLQVSITPDFSVGSNGGWRGAYNPGSSAPAFFGEGSNLSSCAGYQQFVTPVSYGCMVVHYAWVAQQYNATMFYVGSEMDSSQQYASEWESLVSAVRKVYTGKVLYDVNWDAIGNVPFYSVLDAMSISAYFPLSNEENPSLATLEAAWKSYNGYPFGSGGPHMQGSWTGEIEQAEQTWQLPIYFGEVGYSPSTYAAQWPATESDFGGNYNSDPQLQYRCYEALLDTFRSYTWWGGVDWWAWDTGGYNMAGEPAEALIGVNSVAYVPPAQSGAGSGSSAGATGATGTTAASSRAGDPRYAAGSATAAAGGSLSAPVASGGSSVKEAPGSTPAASQNPATAAGAGSYRGATTGPGGSTVTFRTRTGGHGSGLPTVLAAIAVALLLLAGGVWVVVKRRVFARRPKPLDLSELPTQEQEALIS
ncbi:MAG TPA: hypothetical protein VKU88_10530 [Acidimicrobiales bacterium]|nr:hypothetical protein [Acidimicrobiales bacterium]